MKTRLAVLAFCIGIVLFWMLLDYAVPWNQTRQCDKQCVFAQCACTKTCPAARGEQSLSSEGHTTTIPLGHSLGKKPGEPDAYCKVNEDLTIKCSKDPIVDPPPQPEEH